MESFTPSRLTLARKRRAMTKRELGEATGLSDRSIIAHEAGESEPSPDVISAFSRVLRFPKEFFFAHEVHLPEVESANFRALTSMTARQRDAALAAGALAIELASWISDRFDLPKLDVPDLAGVDPETAAETVRAAWGLGERPVRNMVHLMEARGIRVFSLAEDAREVDAFSLWLDSAAYVFLNTKKSAERSRLDAAHELGHLVMHRTEAPAGRRAEVEAQKFGSAFLMPRGSIALSAGGMTTLESLITLKRNWNVSVAALAYRLHELKYLTEWQYRILCVQLQQFGYRTSEPNSISRESSRVLEQVFDVLRKEWQTKAEVARKLYMDVNELESLVFGLVILPVRGERANRSTSTPSARSSGLKLVDGTN
jgi:Zn-dependent peptidase ImmA (M78 family)/transcriptional regulator with XRE-family HTH domain